MLKHLDRDLVSNTSDNATIDDLIARAVTRRQFLRAGIAGAVVALPGASLLAGCASEMFGPGAALGFAAIPPSTADRVVVPPGYQAQVLYRWGDSVGAATGSPEFKPDASNTADEQALQAGMHHDAIEYFPLPRDARSTARGLLAINHEYTDDGLLHPDGMKTWSAEKVRKSQAAHGVSVDRGRAGRASSGAWCGRRSTRGASPRTRRCGVAGPAAGTAYMKHEGRPDRRRSPRYAQQLRGRPHALGHVPHLRGELQRLLRQCPDDHRRDGGATASAARAGATAGTSTTRASTSTGEPNEPNRFGWVVEIDPYDPRSHAGEAHRARPLQARGRDAHARGRRPRRGLQRRRRALRVHLQVRLARPLQRDPIALPTATCSTTARCTSRASTATAPASGCALAPRQPRPHQRGRLRRARPTC